MFSGLIDEVPHKLGKSTTANAIRDLVGPHRAPLLRNSTALWHDRSSVCLHSIFTPVGYCNPQMNVSLPAFTTPKEKIREIIFPFYSPTRTSIGDQESHNLITIDDFIDKPIVAFSSILKKRHKKMKKHQYMKRRKRDVFKRRHLENLKVRKKRTRERKEERRRQQEAQN